MSLVSVLVACDKNRNLPIEPDPVEPVQPVEPTEPEDKGFTLPVVRISYYGTLALNSYCQGTFVILDPDKHYSDVDDLRGSLQVKGRGNSTWGMPKKPLRLKFDSKSEVLTGPYWPTTPTNHCSEIVWEWRFPVLWASPGHHATSLVSCI